MLCSIGELQFHAGSRKLEINRSGKNTFVCHLAKSLCGYQSLPDPVQKPLSFTNAKGFHFEWPGITSLEIKKLLTATAKGALDCYQIEWRPQCWDFVPVDMVELEGARWYGGAEMYEQRWPSDLQSTHMQNYVSGDYLQNKQEYGDILEPFWISSSGIGIHIDERTPLHVSFNEHHNKQMELKAEFRMSRYQNHKNEFPVLKYTICVAKDIKQLWLNMFPMFFKTPTAVPDEVMLMFPIWSTWARYKVDIDERKVLDFADEIKKHGFPNSQIEIDDMYTTHYGEMDFDPKKFPNAKRMVKQLHSMGFRVTSWTHPFANVGSPAFEVGSEKGYFIKESNGKDTAIIKWWQGHGAILDVTNEAACDWYIRRLQQFQKDYGMDSFKFDAGETNWLPENRCTFIPMMNPCDYTTRYVDMVANLGSMVETRVGYRSQRHPIFVRMMDKDSHWGYDNGLKSMIPTALLMGILGYPFILPDMIGGNGYDGDDILKTTLPSKELFIRWTQLSAYLPAMQFSVVPWQYDAETVAIALKAVKEHQQIVTPLVIEAACQSIQHGSPIIRPLWWHDCNDETNFTIDNQFLVGDTLLVAPVVDDNARSRDIYLPQGLWKDCLRGGKLEGGRWLHGFKVELDEIATFLLDN